MEEFKVEVVTVGVDGGHVWDFGNLEVVGQLLQGEVDGRWLALVLDGELDALVHVPSFHEQLFTGHGFNEDGQLAAVVLHVVQRTLQIHLGAVARDADGLGAQYVVSE